MLTIQLEEGELGREFACRRGGFMEATLFLSRSLPLSLTFSGAHILIPRAWARLGVGNGRHWRLVSPPAKNTMKANCARKPADAASYGHQLESGKEKARWESFCNFFPCPALASNWRLAWQAAPPLRFSHLGSRKQL